MHFGVHFPLENVQQGNCYVFCLAKNKALHLVVCKNVFVRFDVQKCIFAYIFPWKMFSITFDEQKYIFARQILQMNLMQKYIFAYILQRFSFRKLRPKGLCFCTFCSFVSKNLENVQHVKYDAKMSLMPKFILAYTLLLCSAISKNLELVFR